MDETLTFEERRRIRVMERDRRHRFDGIAWLARAVALGVAPIAVWVIACHVLAVLMQAGVIPC